MEVVGKKVTTIVALSLLSRSSSFFSPVLSLPFSSSRNTPEMFKDSNGHPPTTNRDNLFGKECLLNLRGGTVDIENGNDPNDECVTVDDAFSYRTVQVQVIHRHGDRTPITPLKDKEFWAQQLVPKDLLERVASGTRVLRLGCTDSGKNKLEVHAAAGRGPFGKLTKLGLLGMVQVGTNLKEDLEESTLWSERTTASNILSTTLDRASSSDIFRIRFSPKDIKVYSTNFARTIQSVQGLLVGFFPDGLSSEEIDIDCRDTTSWMIPDPQPRQTKEQEDLERQLAQRPHVLKRDLLMRPLAARVTKSLRPLLGEEAFQISFGVEDNEDKDKEEYPTLPWIQLTEITKCLSVRNMLPDSISKDDQETLSAHTAWKWFQSLRAPRLAYLSMRRFTETIVGALQNWENEPPLIVYSCHDSSLIGLLCALRLNQPSVWPEYGAVLKVELLEKKNEKGESDAGDDSDVTHVLRFFLNGELLRSMWNGNPRGEIPMEEFVSLISTEVKDVKI